MKINEQNVVVGAGFAFVSGHVTAAAGAGSTTSTTVLNPITDAEKFTVGDIITVAANTEKVQISGINPATGTLTHAAVTTAATAAAAVTQVWRNLGATDGGVELTGGMSSQDHFVDQSVYPVATTLQQGSVGLRIPMAEQTLQNLALALGQEPTKVVLASGVEVLKVGATDQVREDAFLIVGPGPNGKRRSVRIHRGVNRGTLSYRMDKQNKAVANLEVGALFDSTQPAGEELMTIKDHATAYQF